MNVTVFMASTLGNRPDYLRATVELGDEILKHGYGLVYGGNRDGLMGELANRVLAGGGKVIGVVSPDIIAFEPAHEGLTELIEVPSILERKATLRDLGDAMVILPGGLGTLEELFEVWTGAKIGTLTKPIVLINEFGYYNKLVDLIDHVVDEGFLTRFHADYAKVVDTPKEAMDYVLSVLKPD